MALSKATPIGSELRSGLIFFIHELAVPVPLTNVDIIVKVVDFVAEVTIEQKYVNREANPIEVVYMFPVEESATVVNFEAEVDGRKIVTQVRAKEEAREEYDQAMQDRKTAVLFEETSPDIFRIKVGQLKPGAGAKIIITYISELPIEEEATRLTVPTTIAPRYVPATDNTEAAKIISEIPYSLTTPAPLTFNLEVLSQSKVKSIKSPSHALNLISENEANGHGQFVSKRKLSTQTTDLDKDLVVLIEQADPHKPTVFLEKSDNNTWAGMVSLVPSFSLKDQKTELIFLVDRSGSMGANYRGEGGTIEAAKKALALFLHSLPMDCYFNIVSFGSSFDSLFSGSQKYDDGSLAKAKSHVITMEANYGGTEIYQPLDSIFKQPTKEGYLRQIFILTDGEVSNSESVILLVKKNSRSGRVFALGLGASASRHLVKGIARAGAGTALFAAENEDLRPKVMAQLKNAMQPAVSDVEVIWEGISSSSESPKQQPELETKKTLLGYMKPKAMVSQEATKKLRTVGQAPEIIPPIYDGTRMLVYNLFSEEMKDLPKNVTIKAITPDGALSVDLPVGLDCQLDGQFVHQLAARKLIQDLEETDNSLIKEEELKKAVIELGILHKIASKYTSFIGVDTKNPKQGEQAMITRNIKNQVPSGFGSSNFHLQFGSARAPMAYSSTSQVLSKGVKKNKKMPRMSARMSVDQKFKKIDDMAISFGISDDLDKQANLTNRVSISFQGGESKPEKKTGQDLTSDLIDLQLSDGHFKWGSTIETATGKSKKDLKSSRPDFASEDVWMTAICIAILEARKSEKDIWELVVIKARKYLSMNLNQELAEKIAQEAQKFVSN